MTNECREMLEIRRDREIEAFAAWQTESEDNYAAIHVAFILSRQKSTAIGFAELFE